MPGICKWNMGAAGFSRLTQCPLWLTARATFKAPLTVRVLAKCRVAPRSLQLVVQIASEVFDPHGRILGEHAQAFIQLFLEFWQIKLQKKGRVKGTLGKATTGTTGRMWSASASKLKRDGIHRRKQYKAALFGVKFLVPLAQPCLLWLAEPKGCPSCWRSRTELWTSLQVMCSTHGVPAINSYLPPPRINLSLFHFQDPALLSMWQLYKDWERLVLQELQAGGKGQSTGLEPLWLRDCFSL